MKQLDCTSRLSQSGGKFLTKICKYCWSNISTARMSWLNWSKCFLPQCYAGLPRYISACFSAGLLSIASWLCHFQNSSFAKLKKSNRIMWCSVTCTTKRYRKSLVIDNIIYALVYFHSSIWFHLSSSVSWHQYFIVSIWQYKRQCFVDCCVFQSSWGYYQ